MAKTIDPEAVKKEFEAFFAKKQADVSAAIDALLAEQNEIQRKAEERKQQIREQIKPLNDLYQQATGKPYFTETPSPKKRGRGASTPKAGELTGEALIGKGREAIAYLKKRKGEWVRSGEIAKAIGYSGLMAAIAATPDKDEVEDQKGGRAKEYRYKG